jgi:hypothetical protein
MTTYYTMISHFPGRTPYRSRQRWAAPRYWDWGWVHASATHACMAYPCQNSSGKQQEIPSYHNACTTSHLRVMKNNTGQVIIHSWRITTTHHIQLLFRHLLNGCGDMTVTLRAYIGHETSTWPMYPVALMSLMIRCLMPSSSR